MGFAGLSLAVGYERNDDPYSAGGYAGTNLKASLYAELPGRADLRATLRFSDSESESFPEASGGSELAVIRDLEKRDTQELTGGLQFHQAATEWLDLDWALSHSQRWEDLISPEIFFEPGPLGFAQPGTESSTEWRRTQLSGSARIQPWDPLSITTGGDVYWERGHTDTTFFFPGFSLPGSFDLARRVGGVFAEGLLRFDWGLAISASIRGDFPDQAPGEWSPAVGATFQLPKTPLTVFGNWSEGYKLPSFFALGNPLVGDPTLDPERSEGWEIGLRARLFGGRVRSRIAYFDIEVLDLIDLDTSDPMNLILANLDKVISRGVEVEVEVPFSDRLRFGGSATFNPTDIKGSEEDLPRRPRWSGELHVSGSPLESVELGLRVLFVGDFSDFSIPTGDQILDGYTKVDVTASWQVHQRFLNLFR